MKTFRGEVIGGEEKGALAEGRGPTVWIGGSRPDSGKVGAAAVWWEEAHPEDAFSFAFRTYPLRSSPRPTGRRQGGPVRTAGHHGCVGGDGTGEKYINSQRRFGIDGAAAMALRAPTRSGM